MVPAGRPRMRNVWRAGRKGQEREGARAICKWMGPGLLIYLETQLPLRSALRMTCRLIEKEMRKKRVLSSHACISSAQDLLTKQACEMKHSHVPPYYSSSPLWSQIILFPALIRIPKRQNTHRYATTLILPLKSQSTEFRLVRDGTRIPMHHNPCRNLSPNFCFPN